VGYSFARQRMTQLKAPLSVNHLTVKGITPTTYSFPRGLQVVYKRY